jgi:ribosomal protein S18 acetylase RimI-like enzyme
METEIIYLTAQEAEAIKDRLVEVYRSAFAAPPYGVDEGEVASFATKLVRHVRREGFRCCVAQDSSTGRIIGFAYGYTSRPGQWWRDIVAEAMDPQSRERWLSDAFEFVELGVMPEFQGKGIGGRLHDALLDRLPHRTAVLSTARQDTPAQRLYRHRGWLVIVPELFFPGSELPYIIMGKELAGRAGQ